GGGRKKAAAEPVAQEVAAPLPPAPIVAVPAPAVEIALAPEPVAVPAPAVEVALAPDPVALAAPSAPTLDVPVEGLLASSPFASNESIWKKEISFRRKPADPQEPAVDEVSGDDPPEPPVSIWKKEITFRRKGDPAEDKAKSDSIWHKDISLRRSQARSAQIRALAEEALRQVEASTPPEPWLAGPELPPEPTAEPEAAAPEQPTEPEEPKKSIWKRELGTPKASKEPKAEKPEKPKKTPKAEKPEKSKKTPKAERAPKPKTRLRDMKISLPKPAPKVHSSGGHAVKRLVGLKIGASQLAAARVSNNGAAELMQVARQPLQQGVVVGGEVRDPEALALALKQFFAKNKLPRKNVRLGIASNRIGVRVFDLVGINDEKQLENAIRFRAQEALPIPLDEAVLDYHVLGESVDADGTVMQRVLLVVAYRELVERYVSACKKAGITLAGVDLE